MLYITGEVWVFYVTYYDYGLKCCILNSIDVAWGRMGAVQGYCMKHVMAAIKDVCVTCHGCGLRYCLLHSTGVV